MLIALYRTSRRFQSIRLDSRIQHALKEVERSRKRETDVFWCRHPLLYPRTGKGSISCVHPSSGRAQRRKKKRNKVDVYIHVEDGWPALDNIRHRLSFQPLEKRRKKRRKKEMMNPFAQQMAKLGHRMRHSLGEISKKK